MFLFSFPFVLHFEMIHLTSKRKDTIVHKNRFESNESLLFFSRESHSLQANESNNCVVVDETRDLFFLFRSRVLCNHCWCVLFEFLQKLNDFTEGKWMISLCFEVLLHSTCCAIEILFTSRHLHHKLFLFQVMVTQKEWLVLRSLSFVFLASFVSKMKLPPQKETYWAVSFLFQYKMTPPHILDICKEVSCLDWSIISSSHFHWSKRNALIARSSIWYGWFCESCRFNKKMLFDSLEVSHPWVVVWDSNSNFGFDDEMINMTLSLLVIWVTLRLLLFVLTPVNISFSLRSVFKILCLWDNHDNNHLVSSLHDVSYFVISHHRVVRSFWSSYIIFFDSL
jgi:hypothetical protein